MSLSRFQSLDVFRGFTIALMIIVNSPGNQTPYEILAHSAWNGCTFADLVFPFFVIIVGMSSVIALSQLQRNEVAKSIIFIKIFRRSAYLFLLGILLNIFPNHFDLTHLRIFGVLQRIGICYLVSSLCFLLSRPRTQAILLGAILIGYSFLSAVVAPHLGFQEPGDTLAGYVDALLLGTHHLYLPTFDPEGILSTFPALASALLGNLIGIALLSRPTSRAFLLWGVLLTLFGGLWHFVLPINKSLWSSSYVLWSGGVALLLYGLIYELIEVKRHRRFALPFDYFGRHALLIYILHVAFLKIQAVIYLQTSAGESMNLRLFLTQMLFGQFSPPNAALFYSVSYTLLWLFVLVQVEFFARRKRI